MYSSGNRPDDPAAHRYFCTAEHCAHCHCRRDRQDLGTGLELGCATVFLADVVDYGEYKLGVRNEGVVFSLQTLIVKLTAAFTSLSIGFALDLTGYVPNQIQSLATQNSIRVLMCVIPAVGMLLAYVVYRRKYKLNDAYMKKVVSAISSPQTELTSEKTTEEAA